MEEINSVEAILYYNPLKVLTNVSKTSMLSSDLVPILVVEGPYWTNYPVRQYRLVV